MNELPKLYVRAIGEITKTNMSEYKNSAEKYVEGIASVLEEDIDFTNANEDISICHSIEDEISKERELVISKIKPVTDALDALDELYELLRSKRISLTKLIKVEKEKIKAKVLQDATDSILHHLLVRNFELRHGEITEHELGVNFVKAIEKKHSKYHINRAIAIEVVMAKEKIDRIFDVIKSNENALNKINECYVDKILREQDISELTRLKPAVFIETVNKLVDLYKNEAIGELK